MDNMSLLFITHKELVFENPAHVREDFGLIAVHPLLSKLQNEVIWNDTTQKTWIPQYVSSSDIKSKDVLGTVGEELFKNNSDNPK